MRNAYDCIVLGCGGIGSAALDHLAQLGIEVLGLEQYAAVHARGSSHGESRVIRKAYFEHPDYVPLLERAYTLWRGLEADTGATLYHETGLLLAGPPMGAVVTGARGAARRHGLALDELGLSDARARYPAARFREGDEVLFEREAGYLAVEASVRAQLDRALSHGAVLKTDERVVEWTCDETSVRVRTDRDEYQAGRLIITAGAWAGRMLASLSLPLEVVRKVVTWHAVNCEETLRLPVSYFERPEGDFYFVPGLDGQTVKIGEHTGGDIVDDPAGVDRSLRADETARLAAFLRDTLPGVVPEPARHAVCLYTLTPDRHFVVDWHPAHRSVVVGAGFSGHGFKFASVLGEELAHMAMTGRRRHPTAFLSLDRESLQSPPENPPA